MASDNIENENSTSFINIELKSKELSGLFENNIISTDATGDKLKISLSDNDIDLLKDDLKQIAQNCPQLLRNVEIENATFTPLDIQNVINEVFEAKDLVKDSKEFNVHTNITIISSHKEDFEVDFSNIGKQFSNKGIGFRNIGNETIEIPNIINKIPADIKEFLIEGFDVSKLDLTNLNLEKLTLLSEFTTNIDKINGIEKIGSLQLDGIKEEELNKYITNIYAKSELHELVLLNQALKNRNIISELAVLKSLVSLVIKNSQLNNVNGIEEFQGRLKNLSLAENDLDVEDIKKVNAIKEDEDFEYDLSGNTRIISNIEGIHISEASYRAIANQLISSGEVPANRISNKTQVIDSLLCNNPDIPYYIKDAEAIRGKLNITNNPMMLENDEEIDTFDFNQEYLKGGNLLLSLSQIEKLIESEKKIPQNIILKIESVADISSEELKALYNNAKSSGVNLEYVQIFDKHSDNKHTQLTKYTLSEYVYIRDTLDSVVEDIDMNESDIDKFATVYMRLADSISYDHDATKCGTSAEAQYYNKVKNSSRNLLNGLKDGKCVCAGYADILRNALALVGVDSRINSGLMDKNNPNSGHAWNQVKIDGKWYNTDLTFDRRKGNAQKTNFEFMLMGQEEFKKDHQYTKTQGIEYAEKNGYDRRKLNKALQKAQSRTKDFTKTSDFSDRKRDIKQVVFVNPKAVNMNSRKVMANQYDDNGSGVNTANAKILSNENLYTYDYTIKSENEYENLRLNAESIPNEQKEEIKGIRKVWNGTKKFFKKIVSPIASRISRFRNKRKYIEENRIVNEEKLLSEEREELKNRIRFETSEYVPTYDNASGPRNQENTKNNNEQSKGIEREEITR